MSVTVSQVRASIPAWSSSSAQGPARRCGMGRHTAADGASAHPLVAAALAQREVVRTHRSDGTSPPEGGNVGWPAAPEPGGGSVGWPGRRGEDERDEAAGRTEQAAPDKRRGWRRLFGAEPAA